MMSKSILVLCLVVAIWGLGVGCTKNTGNVVTTPNSELPPNKFEESQDLVMENFQNLLDSNPNEKAIIKFIKAKAPSLSKENASQLVLELENLQELNISESYYPEDEKNAVPILNSEAETKLHAAIKSKFSMDIIPTLKDENLKNHLTDIAQKGYKIISTEGMFEVIIDYEKYKEFNNFVTPDIKDYISIKAKESNARSTDDAAMIITIDEVFDRALATEKYIKTYPESERLEEVMQIHEMYVAACFYGQNNTPAFDYNTNVLAKNFRDSYEKLALKNIDSNLVKSVKEYLQVLKKENFKRTSEVEDVLEDVMDNFYAY